MAIRLHTLCKKQCERQSKLFFTHVVVFVILLLIIGCVEQNPGPKVRGSSLKDYLNQQDGVPRHLPKSTLWARRKKLSSQLNVHNAYRFPLEDELIDGDAIETPGNVVMQQQVASTAGERNHDDFGEPHGYHNQDLPQEAAIAAEVNEETEDGGSDEVRQDDEESPFSNWHKTKQQLYPGARLTKGQSTLLIAAFSLRHSLTEVALADLLQLINMHTPIISVPTSAYYFHKEFKNQENSHVHFYCSNKACKEFIPSEHIACPQCGTHFSKDTHLKNGHFFFALSIKQQLKGLLKQPNVSTALGYRFDRKKIHPENIEDIYDGEFYKSIAELRNKDNLSFTLNTDGVPLHKSSSSSIWPIQLLINELPPKLRWLHVILAGVWFGTSKPVIRTFFKCFVDEMKELSNEGFEWTSANEIKRSRVFPILCPCDSVARCFLQGIQQFNGEFGCSWCLHRGVTVAKGNGTVRVYPSSVQSAPRTAVGVIRHATEAINSGKDHVFGVQTASPLLLLQTAKFDIVNSFSVDYMHAVLLGCTRQFATLWFDSNYHNSPWYVGLSTQEIDKRLLKIRPPNEITRLPRSVACRKYWKATEWRNWLLYYSIPVLHGLLPNRFLLHWAQLVDGVQCLLGMSITLASLQVAKNKLERFVCSVEHLYGQQFVSYNIHLLTHLVSTVQNFGPLWCSSAFPFESYNGKLLKMFQGTNAVAKQIVSCFLFHQELPRMVSWLQFDKTCADSFLVETFLNNLVSQHPLLKKASKCDCGVTVIGPASFKILSNEKVSLINPFLHVDIRGQRIPSYKNVIISNRRYCTVGYGRNHKRNRYTVTTKNGYVAEIQDFVVIATDSEEVCCAILYLYDVQTDVSLCREVQHLFTARRTNTLVVCKASNIKAKCVFVGDLSGSNACYCCYQPNIVEAD